MKTHLLHTYIVITFIFYFSYSIAQESSYLDLPLTGFTNVSERLGVPGEFARCMIQDQFGFMWIGTDRGFKYFDGYSYKEYFLENKDHWVTAILEDHNGDIWAYASADVLYHLDRKQDVISKYTVVEDSLEGLQIYGLISFCQTLIEDSQHNIYLSSYNGFKKFDKKSAKILSIGEADEMYRGHLIKDNDGNLWEVKANGIQLFQSSKPLIPFLNLKGEEQVLDHDIFHVIIDKSGNFWMACGKDGLYKFNVSKRILTHFQHDPSNPYSIGLTWIVNIFEDSKGLIWVSADDGGLIIYHPSSNKFFHYPIYEVGVGGMSGKGAAVFEDRNDGIWISQFHTGILYRGAFTKPFESYTVQFRNSKGLQFPYISWNGGLFERNDGAIWIATDGGGFYLWDRKNNIFKNYQHQLENPNSISNNKCSSILEDDQGFVWINTSDGVNRMNIKTGKFNLFQRGDLFLDNYNDIWLTSNGGIHKFNYAKDQFELTIPNYYGLFQDKNKNYWVGTTEGLCKYNFDSESTQSCIANNGYQVQQDSKGTFWIMIGNQGDTIMGYDLTSQMYIDTLVLHNPKDHMRNHIVIDKNDDLWVLTNNGIYQYSPSEKILNHFDYEDGLVSNYFRLSSSICTEEGELIIGSTRGLNTFHPDSLKKNNISPPVIITRILLANEEVKVNNTVENIEADESPLKKHIHFTDSIYLSYWQNDISLEFTALNYDTPLKNQYKYKLVGFDKDWVYTDASSRVANYTNLAPGRYTFRVMGSNNDGVWNEEGDTLFIRIFPPWYWAWWSKTIYFLLFALLLYFLYRFQVRRQLTKAETERLKELDEVKSRLYTNVTHEFRTPLTIISGMVHEIREKPDDWVEEGLDMIDRNSQQLLGLVNQMLELAKLESGSLPVNVTHEDIVGYTKYIVESFHSYAGSKNIRIHFLPEINRLEMDVDIEKMQMILVNLISNSLKFTSEGGNVYVKVRNLMNPSMCEIDIIDTGVGIPEEALPHIFDRFYQVDDATTRKGEGTGIGLTLTKELVVLLGGNILASSKLDEGTHFTIQLPITHEAKQSNGSYGINEKNTNGQFIDLASTTSQPFLRKESVEKDNEELPLALLVEDNVDVLTYLQSCIRTNYRIQTAANGQAGIERALEIVPDIIISDVMMPEKDGYELVSILKQDERTSHIPIILLTAKADIDSKIVGLEVGADAYLAKPFHRKELDVQLENLIRIREQLRQRYKQLNTESPPNNEQEKREDAFVTKIRECIETYMSDENFGIPQLCKEIGISRSQLHKKLKALTGKSTSHVIRTIRLQKAMELLKDTDKNISEIGYEVGFSSRSYFSQVFTQAFGHPPSHFK